MTDTGDFLLGMVVGGILGFAAGLMVAPESGESTRERLRDQARSVAEEFREGAEEFTIKLKDGAEEVMKRASTQMPGPEELDAKLETVEQKLRKLEEQLESSS